jgi:hypothetical protein
MGNPSDEILGLITAVVFIGGIVGALFASWPADTFGRRVTLFGGSLLSIVGSVLQSAAPGRSVFIAGRLILGIGISFTTSAGPSLLNEVAHPRLRGPMASMVRGDVHIMLKTKLTRYPVQCLVVCWFYYCRLAIFWGGSPEYLLVLANPFDCPSVYTVSRDDRIDIHARVTSLVVFKRPN